MKSSGVVVKGKKPKKVEQPELKQLTLDEPFLCDEDGPVEEEDEPEEEGD
jgi:hypothetical protein